MTAAAVASIAHLAHRNAVSDAAQRQTNARVSRTPDSGQLDQLRRLVLRREQLADLPDPEPLISDTLDRATVAMLAGHHGTGKSFIALSWACSIATGHHWLSRPAITSRVLYVASEGAEGLHGRISAWEDAWRTPVTGLDVLPQPWALGKEAEAASLTEAAIRAPYGLVVIDTLARCAVGLDENSARDMGLIVDAADRIRRASRATVLLVHHTGKDKTTVRGSSALEAAADTVYAVESDGPAITLSRTKRKDGPLHDVLPLRLESAPGGSCYVHAGRGQDHDLAGTPKQLMSVFMSAFSATGASKAELRAAANLAPSSFHRGLNALLNDGLLVDHGSQTRPFYRQKDTP